MKGEDLLQAMDGIDEAILAESMNHKRPRLRWLPAVAACLAAALLIGIFWPTAAPTPNPIDTQNLWAMRQEGELPESAGSYSVIGPQGLFHANPVVLARAVEVLPDTYEELPAYGVTAIKRWRIFRMEIMDPLDSGLTGEFYFGLPEGYYQDLTAWDTLMISLFPPHLDLTLWNKDSETLQTFDCLYWDTSPYHGEIMAFTDGIFDENLWQGWADPGWFPMSAYECLQRDDPGLLVQRGYTLEQTLAAIEARRIEDDVTPTATTVSEAALAAMDSLDASYLSTGYEYRLVNSAYVKYICYTRFINGCATNEYALIHPETGEIIYSDAHFGPEDVENLPDLATLVHSLDWDDLELQEDENRGELLYRSIYGWYEKTESGVLAFVKVTWYHESKTAYVVYDDLYLQVTADGTEILTRQQIAELLGERNPNLPDFYDPGDKEGPIHMMWKY